MRIVRRPTFALAVIPLILIALAGCTLMYPRFDNPLNPDIAYANTGDVVDSIKCSITKLYIDRAAQLRQKAVEKLWRECSRGTLEAPEWRIKIQTVVREPGDEKECGDNSRCKCEMQDLTDYREATLKARILQTLKCKKPKPRFGLYRYIRSDSKSAPPGQCGVENGGCPPGTRRKVTGDEGDERFITEGIEGTGEREFGGQCLLDDTGRFALDPQGKAKIELSMQAVNNGSMNYTKIDASNWGALNHIILAGNAAKGFPFPTLKNTDKKTNKVDIVVNQPQADTIREEIPKRDQDGKIVDAFARLLTLQKAINALERDRDKPPGATEAVREVNEGDIRRKFDRELKKVEDEEAKEEARARVLEQRRRAFQTHKPRPPVDAEASRELREKTSAKLSEAAGEGYQDCGFLKINFLALSDYIGKVVNEQEDTVHKGRKGGSLEPNLDSIVLQSQFQIIFDATAGTQNLLRIVPVLSPPVLQLTPDHTHGLKITLQGRKGRGTANNTKSLIERCVERLKGARPPADPTGRPKSIEQECESPQNILLESIIESVEAIKSASN